MRLLEEWMRLHTHTYNHNEVEGYDCQVKKNKHILSTGLFRYDRHNSLIYMSACVYITFSINKLYRLIDRYSYIDCKHALAHSQIRLGARILCSFAVK